MRYYDLKGSNWTRVVAPHLQDEEVQRVLARDFHKFTMGRWNERFEKGMVPRDFESCDWDIWCRRCRFHDYVKHAACHWIVNFALALARAVSPRRRWRIITTQAHSTVWDGQFTLFDFNFYAFGIPAMETFQTAYGRELPVGRYLRVYYAEHFSRDLPSSDRSAS